MKIYAIEIESKMHRPLSEKLGEVGINSQLQIKKFKRREDAVRKLYGELMIRKLIREELLLRNEEICIHKNDFGKPFLPNFPDFHYNLSHSGKWIVCAVDWEPVGIDIEEMKQEDLGIAKQFFAKEEVEYLFSQLPNQQNKAFFELWTLKESYIKQLGMGLSIKLKDFAMIKKHDGWRVKSDKYCEEVFFKQYDVFGGYQLALCGSTKDFPNEIIYLEDI